VLYLVGLDQGAITPPVVAEIAEVGEVRAKAYLSILGNAQALIESPDGWVRGPGWQSWSSMPSRSRPTATKISTTAVADMERMRRTIAMRVIERTQERKWTLRQLADRAGVHHEFLRLLRRRHRTPPALQLLLIARALDTTVEDLAKS
jgi:DNA-binding Xre family transcriptional regulator